MASPWVIARSSIPCTAAFNRAWPVSAMPRNSRVCSSIRPVSAPSRASSRRSASMISARSATAAIWRTMSARASSASARSMGARSVICNRRADGSMARHARPTAAPSASPAPSSQRNVAAWASSACSRKRNARFDPSKSPNSKARGTTASIRRSIDSPSATNASWARRRRALASASRSIVSPCRAEASAIARNCGPNASCASRVPPDSSARRSARAASIARAWSRSDPLAR